MRNSARPSLARRPGRCACSGGTEADPILRTWGEDLLLESHVRDLQWPASHLRYPEDMFRCGGLRPPTTSRAQLYSSGDRWRLAETSTTGELLPRANERVDAAGGPRRVTDSAPAPPDHAECRQDSASSRDDGLRPRWREDAAKPWPDSSPSTPGQVFDQIA